MALGRKTRIWSRTMIFVDLEVGNQRPGKLGCGIKIETGTASWLLIRMSVGSGWRDVRNSRQCERE